MNSPPAMRAVAPSLVSSFAPDVSRVKRVRGKAPRVRFGVHGPANPPARISMALLGMSHSIAALGDSVTATLADLPAESRELEPATFLEWCVEDLRVVRTASRRIALMACDDRLVPLLLPGASLSAFLRSLGGFVAAAIDALEEIAGSLADGGRTLESPALQERVEAARACYRGDLARGARLDVALLPIEPRQGDDALARIEESLEALTGATEALHARMGRPAP
jgi:hypothetical protein